MANAQELAEQLNQDRLQAIRTEREQQEQESDVAVQQMEGQIDIDGEEVVVDVEAPADSDGSDQTRTSVGGIRIPVIPDLWTVKIEFHSPTATLEIDGSRVKLIPNTDLLDETGLIYDDQPAALKAAGALARKIAELQQIEQDAELARDRVLEQIVSRLASDAGS